jgi:hypothetical protein
MNQIRMSRAHGHVWPFHPQTSLLIAFLEFVGDFLVLVAGCVFVLFLAVSIREGWRWLWEKAEW